MDEAGIKAILQRFGRADAYNVQFGQTDGDKTVPLLSGAGPFQVRLQNVQSNFNQTVNVSGDKKAVRAQTRRFTLGFDSKTDPIVDVVGSPLVILKRVEDDKGRSLLDTNINRFVRYNFDNFGSTSNSQNIQMPSADAKTLARIEGTATYVVPSARQQWEIADILNNKNATQEFESGGRTVTVTVKSAERAGSGINLNLEMNAPQQNNGAQNDPLFSFGQMAKAFTLQDANGHVFRTGGYSGSGSNGKMEMRGTFNLVVKRGARGENGEKPAAPTLAEPVKLVFDAPTEWVQTQVPFSFSDVPLP